MFPNDTLNREASLKFLARSVEGFHVGGKTALAWRGTRRAKNRRNQDRPKPVDRPVQKRNHPEYQTMMENPYVDTVRLLLESIRLKKANPKKFAQQSGELCKRF
jgi:hypothetical protein